MRPRTLLVAGLLILLIELAARSFARLPEYPVNPATGVNAGGGVPPTVMATLRRACFDCHSDETRWPWYSALPVGFWLLRHDVKEGRDHLNFSRWTEYHPFDRADLLDKVCEKTTKGLMPLWQYRLAHREARLTASDIAAVCAWSQQEAARLTRSGS